MDCKKMNAFIPNVNVLYVSFDSSFWKQGLTVKYDSLIGNLMLSATHNMA